MKRKSTPSIAMLALSLMILFALPAQAHHRVNLTGFQYDKKVDVVTERSEHSVSVTTYWQFSWNTISSEWDFDLQAKGGGIFGTWTTLSTYNVERKDGKTKVYIKPMFWLNEFDGSMNFRVKAYAPNQVTSYWTEISLSSPPNA
ncbi:MAG: hypothetical protein OXG23_15245 [Chloroflexi bacterium]|nr:hypothetical protein [Chloroflexota bacterium]